MQKIPLLLLLSFALPAHAALHVKEVQGEVQFKGKALKQGKVIAREGKISTGSRSFVGLTEMKSGTLIRIGPDSTVDLTTRGEVYSGKSGAVRGFTYKLVEGALRWMNRQGKQSGRQEKIEVSTKSAAMGVRGTDFLVKYGSLLNESEIVVFDGEVELISYLKRDDRVTVAKGQWGGVGGRYGTSIGKPLDLPQAVLQAMNKQLPMD